MSQDKNENSQKEVQNIENYLSKAVEDFFYSSPFHELLNGFQNIVSNQLNDAMASTEIREDGTFLYVDVHVPDSFVNGEILVEVKSRYLHLSMRETVKHSESNFQKISSMAKSILLPYPVKQESMCTSWPNKNTMIISFEKTKA